MKENHLRLIRSCFNCGKKLVIKNEYYENIYCKNCYNEIIEDDQDYDQSHFW